MGVMRNAEKNCQEKSRCVIFPRAEIWIADDSPMDIRMVLVQAGQQRRLARTQRGSTPRMPNGCGGDNESRTASGTD